MSRLPFALLLAFASACAEAPHKPSAGEPQNPSRGTFTDKEMKALYYYDLGPDSIDVSQYPAGQQENYRLFARVCSQCHTLARPINSPRESYVAWKYYVFTMRMRSKFTPGTGYSPEEAQKIVDFLTYDSMLRKDIHRDEYEALRIKLHKRFDLVIEEHMRRLFESLPPPRRSLDDRR